VVPVIAAPKSTTVFMAVLLIGIAASAHQAWSANIFTFVSDMFPKRAVGSVTGLGGAAGAAGGMLFASSAGHIIEKTGSYTILFIIAGSAYLLAILNIQVLAPRLEPTKFDEG
jgi:ACS family hexuronate transporter-like MFS transporter